MNVLIVDDERHAREELARLLGSFPGIRIAGEAANAREAREKIQALSPDLVFLDIQMPEETGFELLGSLGENAPAIIFTTAYDAYALNAFEFGALDYLLKPIAPNRLAAALRRTRLRGSNPEDHEEETPAPELPGKPLTLQDRVLLAASSRIAYVAVEEIIGAESMGAYSKVWLGSGALVVRRSLAVLEARLPPEAFIRANRSQLINLLHVQSVESWFSGGLKVILTGNLTVELSRRQAKLFREKSSL